MSRNAIVTDPVVLDGYQAVMKPGKYGFKLEAIFDQALVDRLEEDRVSLLEWCKERLKNPKRATLKPEPWEEVSEGKYKVKFGWQEDDKYFDKVVDTEGTVITDESLPVYSGSKVRLSFYHKPYILKDGVSYGTSLKLKGVQIISLGTSAGVDLGSDSDDVAEIFGKTDGFKYEAKAAAAVTDDEINPDF